MTDSSRKASLQTTQNERTSGKIGWVGAVALGFAGCINLLALGVNYSAQPHATTVLMIASIFVAWMAAFGWTELVLLRPRSVGGSV